jgi:hypothetical protein
MIPASGEIFFSFLPVPIGRRSDRTLSRAAVVCGSGGKDAIFGPEKNSVSRSK